MGEELWTLDELVVQVAAALPSRPPSDVLTPPTAGVAAGAVGDVERGVEGDGNGRDGRVRAVPDARTIRWYQSTGMVDRPSMLRGRTGLYERRHLLQVLAIKRLQAQGHALADIQALLLGADDATLEGLAEGLTAVPATSGPPTGPAGGPAGGPAAGSAAERRRFWADAPAASTAGQPSASAAEPGDPARGVDVEPVVGVRLGEGVTVLLEQPNRPLTDTDLAALRSACAPLLDVLRTRRLLPATTPVAPKESE